MTVSIIGSGRWARTIAAVLAGMHEAPGPIFLHSRHHGDGVRIWIAEHGLAARVVAVSDWSDDLPASRIVIVANRARDHFFTAIPAIASGAAVLIEKPMAIGQDAVRRLCIEASEKTVLAASHVLLFARYLDAFAKSIEEAGGARRMNIVWEDGAGDTVRGEVKSYDPAVSVFDDVLPHVCPILNRIKSGALVLRELGVSAGGAEVVVHLEVGSVPARVSLGRNKSGRRRLLTVQTEKGPFALDFTCEPGQIAMPGMEPRSGDPLWNHSPRPLRAMLMAFLAAAGGELLDERLSPQKALATAIFADEIRASYLSLQERWLAENDESEPNPGRDYAMQEAQLRERVK